MIETILWAVAESRSSPSTASGCPTESALQGGPPILGGADCSAKPQRQPLVAGIWFHRPSHSTSSTPGRGGTLTSSLGTLCTAGPGADRQQCPLGAPAHLRLHLKRPIPLFFTCLSLCHRFTFL